MARRPSSLTQTVDISSKNYLKSIPLGYFQWTSWLKSPKTGVCETEKVAIPITKAQFADILQNPFYYGVMYYNKSYFPHIYEKLISKELFDKCTEVRTGKFKRTSKHTKEPYIFRGWFAANIAVVCFRLIQRRGSMFICGIQTSRIANTVIISVRKFC